MDCSRFSANNLSQERLDIGAEQPIMGWAYTAQYGDTWSVVAECTGIDEWLLRAVNPLWSNGVFIPEGAPVLIPVIPPGQIAEKVLDPTMEQGYRVLLQYPQVPAFEEPPPFDPHGAVRRWLESLVSENRQVADAYKGSQVGSDLESLEAAFRQTMGRDLFAFLSGVLGVFKEDESPPTVEEFLAAFGDVSTIEMAHFALEVADAADLKYGRMLEDTSALKYHQIPIDQFLLYQGYDQINTTARLREMALAYLMAANIDELRQEVHDWDPSTEQRLLNELEAAIQRIPPQVLGLSTEAIRAHFLRFHATMTQRQLDLQSYKEMIAAYEKAQEPADWSWLLELVLGLASNLNPVLKGIDLALTLRDVFINREPLALLGLVDFIPSSFLRGAGRVLSHLPGMGVVQRFGDDVGAWTKHIANRFIWTNSNGRRKLLLLSSSDPVVSVLGHAYKSERFGSEVDEMIRNLKAHGIEIEFREGMMYSPAKGRPGKFIISKDASIAAWRHEYQHALDDIAANYPGLGPYFEDPVEHWLMEKRAYEVEIRTAMEFDVPEELVARIREAMENRKRELLPPDVWPDYYE